jgi:hypothetical protein
MKSFIFCDNKPRNVWQARFRSNLSSPSTGLRRSSKKAGNKHSSVSEGADERRVIEQSRATKPLEEGGKQAPEIYNNNDK